MKRIEIDHGLYADALPGGRYVCVLKNDTSYVQTHAGPIATQDGLVPLFVTLDPSSDFRFAGQSNNSPDTLMWAGTWIRDKREPCGANPCIFDNDGVLHVNVGCKAGVMGWRYVDPHTGQLVTGDATYSSPWGLSEFTYIGDSLYIGQCNVSEAGCAVWDGTNLRMVNAGPARFIKAHRIGNDVAIAYVQEHNLPSILIFTTVDELRACPIVQEPTPSYDPLTPINRPCYFGWFNFLRDHDASLPANCGVYVGPGGDGDIRTLEGQKIAQFTEDGSDETNLDRMQELVNACYAKDPHVPIFPYWPRALFGSPIPRHAGLGVECYLRANETVAECEAAVRAEVRRGPCWLYFQCYSTNAGLTSDLRLLPPMVSRILATEPNSIGALGFNGNGRNGGYQDHPEVHGDWETVFASIPTPQPPSPTPQGDEYDVFAFAGACR